MLRENEFRTSFSPDRFQRALAAMEFSAPVRLMEVCGTHTMAIAKAGIRSLLPRGIEILSGPGCPVCVSPTNEIDAYLPLSMEKNVVITSYGDMLRIPGSRPGDNLERRRALGADVRLVYSPMDVLPMAEAEPEKQFVFLGVGFETTAPGTAVTLLEARARNIRNFSIFPMLKLVHPALRTLIEEEGFQVRGFLLPGHVAGILGSEDFRYLCTQYRIPSVVAGFEAGDLMSALYLLLKQIEEGRAELVNEYTRVVRPFGNPAARKILEQVFVPEDRVWRGLGKIPKSGLGIRREYADYDALKRFGLQIPEGEKKSPCRCGDVIRGRIPPRACPLFGKACTPEDPVGPCMVSGEGACAAAYKYGI